MKLWNRPRLRIEPGACIGWAFLLLVLPLRWLGAMAAAALWHEICHALAVTAAGGAILRVQIGLWGAEMESEPMPPAKELLCVLAGPVGGLMPVLLAQWMPETALCALCLSAFNLLPLYPLDGGRALRCAVAVLVPARQESICRWTQCVCIGLILLITVWTVPVFGLFPPVLTGILCLRLIRIKKPCKLSV